MLTPDSRILIVDDFEVSRTIIRKALNSAGYTKTEQAKDGGEAFELLQQAIAKKEPFDLVICDWNMPKVSGIELLRQCRKHAGLADLLFFMLSAEGEHQAMKEALDAGATDYLIKPFTSAGFKERIQKLSGKTPRKRA